MADDDKEVGAAYVGWSTFKKALDALPQGLPNQIDRSVWKTQSWGTQSQLVTAFKFLGLTDDKGKPSPPLVELVEIKDEEERKPKLAAIFRERYADLFALDLTKATPDQLDKAMGGYRVTGETREKAIRFFLSAILYLEIPVSKFLQPATGNGAVTTKSHKPRKQREAATPPSNAAPAPSNARVFKLRTPGGELTISTKPDFLALVAADRKLLFDLMEKVEGYEGATENPIPSGQS